MTAFPKVTIMIPTYRQEGCIVRAVNSALSQTYPNLEVIVADDASPDGTAEKVTALRDPRLRYVRHAVNLGRVGNYRKALYELASGEWVVNLDGDDHYTDPDFIAKAVELAYSETGIVIVAAKKRAVTAGGTREPGRLATSVLPGIEVLLHYHDQRYHFAHLATLYRRADALACDFYRRDVISSDWESLLRLALRGKVAYLDRVVGSWNVNEESASLKADWKAMSGNLEIWPAIYEEAARSGIPRAALERSRRATLHLIARRDIWLAFRGGSVVEAFKYLYRGFPVLQAAVVLRILVHPYVWIKMVTTMIRNVAKRLAGPRADLSAA